MPSRFEPQKHHRRSIRLPNYDYSQPGAYFVTIVTWHRECLFGEVVNGAMKLSKSGEIVQWEWKALPQRFRYIELGAHVVMPNHFHGILIFQEHVGATRPDLINTYSGKGDSSQLAQEGVDGSPLPHGPKQFSLGAIIAQFKSRVTKRLWKIPSLKVPQSGSVTITNTSSATKRISKTKQITSTPTPCYGLRMTKTQ